MRISSVIKFNSRTTKDLFRYFYTTIIMHTVFLIRHRLKFSLKRLLYSIHNNEQFCIKRYRDLQSMESNSTPSKVTRAPRKRHKREREREREKSVAKEKASESTRGETAKGARIGFLILLDEERNVSQDGRRNTDK